MQMILGYAGLAAIAGGLTLSMFPLWKSATLSPDSIERRVWWTGCVTGTILLGLSQLPDWRSALFVSIGLALALLAVALFWTNFVKINGRIFAAFHLQRRPDRPPALRRSDDDLDD